MFWHYVFSNNSAQIEKLLQQEDVTLRELMEEEELLQECQAQNKKLIEFLCQDDILEELVSLVVSEPNSDVEYQLRFKYASLAAELLSAEVPGIVDKLAASEDLLNMLCKILGNEKPLNPLLASFFFKVLSMLMHRRNEQNWYQYQVTCFRVLDFLKGCPDFIPRMAHHIGTSAIMSLLHKLMIGVEDAEVRIRIHAWMRETPLISLLISKLGPENEWCEQASVEQLLCDVLDSGGGCANPSLGGANVLAGGNNSAGHAPNSADNGSGPPKPNMLLPLIMNECVVQQLIGLLLHEQGTSSSVTHVSNIIMKMISIHSCPLCSAIPSNNNNGEYSSALAPNDSFDAVVASVVSSVQFSYSNDSDSGKGSEDVDGSAEFTDFCVVHAIAQVLPQIHHMLLNPAQDTLQTSYDMCVERVGSTRLRLIALITSLVETRHLKIHQTIEQLGTIPHILELFFKFPQNNFLHTLVQRCIADLLVQPAPHRTPPDSYSPSRLNLSSTTANSTLPIDASNTSTNTASDPLSSQYSPSTSSIINNTTTTTASVTVNTLSQTNKDDTITSTVVVPSTAPSSFGQPESCTSNTDTTTTTTIINADTKKDSFDACEGGGVTTASTKASEKPKTLSELSSSGTDYNKEEEKMDTGGYDNVCDIVGRNSSDTQSNSASATNISTSTAATESAVLDNLVGVINIPSSKSDSSSLLEESSNNFQSSTYTTSSLDASISSSTTQSLPIFSSENRDTVTTAIISNITDTSDNTWHPETPAPAAATVIVLSSALQDSLNNAVVPDEGSHPLLCQLMRDGRFLHRILYTYDFKLLPQLESHSCGSAEEGPPLGSLCGYRGHVRMLANTLSECSTVGPNAPLLNMLIQSLPSDVLESWHQFLTSTLTQANSINETSPLPGPEMSQMIEDSDDDDLRADHHNMFSAVHQNDNMLQITDDDLQASKDMINAMTYSLSFDDNNGFDDAPSTSNATATSATCMSDNSIITGGGLLTVSALAAANDEDDDDDDPTNAGAATGRESADLFEKMCSAQHNGDFDNMWFDKEKHITFATDKSLDEEDASHSSDEEDNDEGVTRLDTSMEVDDLQDDWESVFDRRNSDPAALPEVGISSDSKTGAASCTGATITVGLPMMSPTSPSSSAGVRTVSTPPSDAAIFNPWQSAPSSDTADEDTSWASFSSGGGGAVAFGASAFSGAGAAAAATISGGALTSGFGGSNPFETFRSSVVADSSSAAAAATTAAVVDPFAFQADFPDTFNQNSSSDGSTGPTVAPALPDVTAAQQSGVSELESSSTPVSSPSKERISTTTEKSCSPCKTVKEWQKMTAEIDSTQEMEVSPEQQQKPAQEDCSDVTNTDNLTSVTDLVQTTPSVEIINLEENCKRSTEEIAAATEIKVSSIEAIATIDDAVDDKASEDMEIDEIVVTATQQTLPLERESSDVSKGENASSA